MMDALNAASGAVFGDPNYWGAPFPFSPVARGLNNVRIFNEEEARDQQTDVALVAFDWDLGDSGIVMTSQTSFVQYDKHDILDPDMSSFAVFVGERSEDFEQISQEIRFTSSQDKRFSWLVGAYYQEHDLTTSIAVHLPWLFDIPNFFFGAPPNPLLDPTVWSAVSFGGPLVENSRWISAFFNTTFNVTDTFRINVGGRYTSIDKTGTENPQLARLPIGGTEFETPFAFGPPVSGTADSNDFLPEVGFQWDATDGVMIYAKYAEALKAGGFVKSPPIGGAVPNPFSYKPEQAEGWEAGIKALLLDGRLSLNVSYYDTDFTDLQVTILNNFTGQFETQNAAKAHTTGIEIDGRWAIAENFSLGFAGAYGEAKYDDYVGSTCNSLEAKIAPTERCIPDPDVPGGFYLDASGLTLPYAPDWSLNLQPEYHARMGGFEVRASANMIFSDGYSIAGVNGDPLSEVDDWMRIDLRFAIARPDGRWEVAVYGRDVTDERRQHTNAFSFLSRSLAPVFDAGGIGRERGARFGLQLTYALGGAY